MHRGRRWHRNIAERSHSINFEFWKNDILAGVNGDLKQRHELISLKNDVNTCRLEEVTWSKYDHNDMTKEKACPMSLLVQRFIAKEWFSNTFTLSRS